MLRPLDKALLGIAGILLLISIDRSMEGDGPSPVPEAGGLRVLVVRDKLNEVGKIPDEVRTVLDSAEVNGFMAAKCGKQPDGSANYRMYDLNQDLTNADEVWRSMMARPRDSLPWIYIDKGARTRISKSYQPKTIEEAKSFVSRYADPLFDEHEAATP